MNNLPQPGLDDSICSRISIIDRIGFFVLYLTMEKTDLFEIFKPGTRPQPAVRAWFTENYFRKSVCLYLSTYLHIYLSLSARTDPREQTILVAKAALIQEI